MGNLTHTMINGIDVVFEEVFRLIIQKLAEGRKEFNLSNITILKNS